MDRSKPQKHLAQGKAYRAEAPPMAYKFAIGDKVHQAFSNHAKGTVVALLTDASGEIRYAVEFIGDQTIQIASEDSLVIRTI
jgi:hypothetical protein